MTDTEITFLARVYAEKDGNFVQIDQDDAEDFLRWLCDRYCLVEKKEVLNLIETHRAESKGLDNGGREWFFYKGRLDLLKNLFPDLEPCTEPKEPSFTDTFTDDSQSQCKSQSRNLSQYPANRDKMFDDILSSGFREHNSLHVATQLLSGLLASGRPIGSSTVLQAIGLADALISELPKQSNR